MARVLITGGTGFIGRRLVRHLAEAGHEVHCLVRRSSNVAALEPHVARLLHGDVGDGPSVASAIAVARPEVVYHLAGLTSALSPRDFDAINHQGAAHVAQACAAQATPPTLLVVSSLAAAGPAPLDCPRVEDDPVAPVSDYGRSKRAGELAAQRFAHALPITIVRPPIVFGPGDLLTLEIFKPIKRYRVHLVPGLRNHPYSLVHADDLIAAMVLLAARGERLALGEAPASSQGYYFVADPQTLTYAQLGRQAGRLFNRPYALIVHLPFAAVWLSAASQQLLSRVTGKPSILNLDKVREAAAGGWACSPAKLQTQFGFRPALPLLARLEETIAWYRQERWL